MLGKGKKQHKAQFLGKCSQKLMLHLWEGENSNAPPKTSLSHVMGLCS